MLALIGNLALPELMVIAVLAVIIFGKRLPEVAARAYVNLRRVRTKLEDLRRESGIDAELRKVERTMRDATLVDISDRTVYDPHRRPPIVPPPGGPKFPGDPGAPEQEEAPVAEKEPVTPADSSPVESDADPGPEPTR